MKLYGSLTSPYVRRIRILLDKQPYDFIPLNIYEGEGRKTISAVSPIKKIPVLEDKGQIIYDSRIIFYYLQEKGLAQPLSWNEENLLSVIDGINDSLVNLFVLKQSDVDLDLNKKYGRNQKERIESSLEYLDSQQAAFQNFNYLSIALFCLLDWAEFRNLIDLRSYKNLTTFLTKFRQIPELKKTDPRL